MSSPHSEIRAEVHTHSVDRWIDQWWPAFVIAFGLLFVALLVSFNPHT